MVEFAARDIKIPANLLPSDGRFGAGPSRIPAAHVAEIASSNLMGTSHRQAPVRALVREIREGLADLLRLPAGYEVVLGNGGASAFWALATVGLVRRHAAHAVFGEFGAKFAKETDRADFLAPSTVFQAEPGKLAVVEAVAGADAYCWPQNETSTGVLSPVMPVAGADPEALTIVDATSSAGAVEVDFTGIDVYYFSPQKAFASDGGLWVAVMSPRAIARVEELASAGRWVPDFLSLPIALDNSRKDQTFNTPALATLILLRAQVRELLACGGLAASAARAAAASGHIYSWAQERAFASPFVERPQWRSPVVATIDFEGVDATDIQAALRANGVFDVFPYRSLGRNQLRVATFPATSVDDAAALTASIDFVVEALA